MATLRRPPNGDQPEIPPNCSAGPELTTGFGRMRSGRILYRRAARRFGYDPYLRRQVIAHRRQRDARRKWCTEHGLDPRTVNWDG